MADANTVAAAAALDAAIKAHKLALSVHNGALEAMRGLKAQLDQLRDAGLPDAGDPTYSDAVQLLSDTEVAAHKAESVYNFAHQQLQSRGGQHQAAVAAVIEAASKAP